MPARIRLSLVLAALLVLMITAGAVLAKGISAPGNLPAGQAPAGMAFSYQGRLHFQGSPASGPFDFQFRLFEDATGASQVGNTVSLAGVPVTNGLFTVLLDFGPGVFNGEARWLEVRVRRGDETGAFTTLGPLQPLTPAPYAMALPGLYTQPNATSPNLIGGFSGNNIAAGVVGATIGGGGAAQFLGAPGLNQVTDRYGVVGGGVGNTAGGVAATVGGGWDNTASNDLATVSGGGPNTASGGRSAVGGGEGNTASGEFATVGGGISNTASGGRSTVGGGVGNNASGDFATVSGGRANTASGPDATVGGGFSNEASNLYATVGGGQNNTASGQDATVPGGEGNIAAGNQSFATGLDNRADGDYSFVVGRRAKNDNLHDGVFMFADSRDVDFRSASANEFAVRATGGVRFVTDIGNSGEQITGCSLPAGSGTLNCTSDRHAKANFSPVDRQDVLEQLGRVPIETWNYKGQHPSIRHIGPMAQDFHAAFGLGDDERYISAVDADGVALAAIQGLYQLAQEQEARIAELEARLAAVEQTSGPGSVASGPLAAGAPVTWLLLGGFLLAALALGWQLKWN